MHALRGVDFHVNEGEVCAIIGPNGAGKSSLLNVINGVYAPSAGTIAYAGETRRAMRPQRAAEQGIARKPPAEFRKPHSAPRPQGHPHSGHLPEMNQRF